MFTCNHLKMKINLFYPLRDDIDIVLLQGKDDLIHEYENWRATSQVKTNWTVHQHKISQGNAKIWISSFEAHPKIDLHVSNSRIYHSEFLSERDASWIIGFNRTMNDQVINRWCNSSIISFKDPLAFSRIILPNCFKNW